MTTILQVIISGLMIGSIYGIISIGITLIYGTLRIVNFAYGEFLMLSMYLTFWIVQFVPINPYLAMIPVALIMFLIGTGVFWFLVRPLVGKKSRLLILLTVGLSFTFQNLALTLWTADFRKVSTGLENNVIRLGSVSISVSQLIAFGFSILFAASLFLFLNYTRTGRAVRAVSQERRAAQLMGININRIYTFTYGLGIALAGVAGMIISPIYYAFPTCGASFSILACIVVVMGGLGSFGGALISGLIIGLIEVLSGYFISPSLNQAVYFLMFIVLILVRPAGLFGLGVGSEEVGFD